jgi:hypothetical protein
MIPMAYDPLGETFRFAWRNIRFVVAASGPSSRLATQCARRLLCSSRPLQTAGDPESSSEKKLRESALKSRKSLARVNFCAGRASGSLKLFVRATQKSTNPGCARPDQRSPERSRASETAPARKSRHICEPRFPRRTSRPKASPPPLPIVRATPRPASS